MSNIRFFLIFLLFVVGCNDEREMKLNTFCAKGDSKACTAIGNLYITSNTQKGISFLKKGCELGDGEACEKAGYALYDVGLHKDGKELLAKSCDQLKMLGCGALAYILFLEGDQRKAEEFHIKACELGLADSCLTLSFDLRGEYKEEYERVLLYLDKACKLEQKEACKRKEEVQKKLEERKSDIEGFLSKVKMCGSNIEYCFSAFDSDLELMNSEIDLLEPLYRVLLTKCQSENFDKGCWRLGYLSSTLLRHTNTSENITLPVVKGLAGACLDSTDKKPCYFAGLAEFYLFKRLNISKEIIFEECLKSKFKKACTLFGFSEGLANKRIKEILVLNCLEGDKGSCLILSKNLKSMGKPTEALRYFEGGLGTYLSDLSYGSMDLFNDLRGTPDFPKFEKQFCKVYLMHEGCSKYQVEEERDYLRFLSAIEEHFWTIVIGLALVFLVILVTILFLRLKRVQSYVKSEGVRDLDELIDIEGMSKPKDTNRLKILDENDDL